MKITKKKFKEKLEALELPPSIGYLCWQLNLRFDIYQETESFQPLEDVAEVLLGTMAQVFDVCPPTIIFEDTFVEHLIEENSIMFSISSIKKTMEESEDSIAAFLFELTHQFIHYLEWAVSIDIGHGKMFDSVLMTLIKKIHENFEKYLLWQNRKIFELPNVEICEDCKKSDDKDDIPNSPSNLTH